MRRQKRAEDIRPHNGRRELGMSVQRRASPMDAVGADIIRPFVCFI